MIEITKEDSQNANKAIEKAGGYINYAATIIMAENSRFLTEITMNLAIVRIAANRDGRLSTRRFYGTSGNWAIVAIQVYAVIREAILRHERELEILATEAGMAILPKER